MSVKKTFYGTTKDLKDVDKFIIENDNGTIAHIITYGATLDRLYVKDKYGKADDILIGFDTLDDHENLSANQGATVGRYANRIANGRFSIDGSEYEVTHNENQTCLHGGNEFAKAVWQGEIMSDKAVKFNYLSPDGSCGFPGRLKVSVTYELSNDDELKVSFQAVSDKKTVMNFTNHAYFNLGGYSGGNILLHMLKIDADKFTPVDENSIPTGELRSVDGTAFDFRIPKEIGRDIHNQDSQLVNARGYDHNFCINNPSIEKPCACVFEPESGRYMELYTDLPGVQLYCANFLSNVKGKDSIIMNEYQGFCLETQFWPDTPNHENFPSCVFDSGEDFKTTSIFKFGIKE